MSQNATSNEAASRGGRRYLPLAFTEHGAIMAATVLNTPRATEVAVYVVRAFVQLREALQSHRELASKLAELERNARPKRWRSAMPASSATRNCRCARSSKRSAN